MITILCILASLIFVGVYLKSNWTTIEEADTPLDSKKLWKGVLIGVVLLILSFVQPFSLQRVDAGHVGILVNLTGDNRGVGKFEYKTGWVVVCTWINRLYEFPTYQQTIIYDEQTVITKGGFSAKIHPKFNYSLKPGNIGDMFSNLRLGVKEIEQGWLQTAIVGSVNDVANRWTVDDIFNRREEFENNIAAEANKRISRWFEVSQLRTNITPPDALQDAIVAKTKAIQAVQVAENEKLVAIALGQKQMATARADSAALVINAAGKAEAIKREQLSLTSLYIDYLKVQKWDGVQPTVVSGGSGLMISLPK